MKHSRRDPEIRQWRPSSTRVAWLACGLLLVLAPHVTRLPVWISVAIVTLCGWRLMRLRGGEQRPPSRWLALGLALLILPGVYLSYGTVTGRSAGVALLGLLGAIKLLETRSMRDAHVICFLCFFLVVTAFLFSQHVLMGVYMMLVVVVLSAAMIAVTSGERASAPRSSARARLTRAVVMVAQAMPVAFALFVLFPRVSGPLWGLPKDAHAGNTGLSEEMSPGSISRLSRSDAVAFRVRFDGAVPPVDRLYWRGPVLDHTDGRRWSRSPTTATVSTRPFQRLGTPVDYEVTLEPHGRRWLLALDLPATLPRGSVISERLELMHRRPLLGRRHYRVRSYLEYALLDDDQADRELALELPADHHPGARRLAQRWREAHVEDEAVVAAALRMFREQSFFYTLEPPLLTDDAVDGFLFSTRKGFCEHYAAAFTVLMRAAGIPARVVTGYLGGDVNPVGDYLIVRQRDAHAWAEVWLAGRGWVRVDPTAAVAPERIDQGVDAALPPTLGTGALVIRPSAAFNDALRTLRHALDTVHAGWNSGVLGYGARRQRELLSRVGLHFDRPVELLPWLGAALALTLGAIALWLLRSPVRRDPLARCYGRFCEKLARHGLPRRADEGPRAFAARVAAARPDLGAAVDAYIDSYVAMRYAGAPPDLTRLRRLSNALRG